MAGRKTRLDYYGESGRKVTTIALPFDVMEALDKIATDEDVNRQTVMLWAARDYIAKYPKLVQAKALVS